MTERCSGPTTRRRVIGFPHPVPWVAPALRRFPRFCFRRALNVYGLQFR